MLVPTSRLELLRLFRPPAPQAGVSTNFTTWAVEQLSLKTRRPQNCTGSHCLTVSLVRDLFRLVAARVLGGLFRLFGRCGRGLLGCRFLGLDCVHHTARGTRLVRGQISQAEARKEEDR